jgi:RNA 3'-terminal phosphate cyclase (ATP)
VIEIDGSFGEGGGQILRTSLALALITGQPFHMARIRSRRAKPGLRRQHLTAVRAAAAIGNAEVTGDAVHSTELTFRPGKVAGGHFDVDVGSAGSTTLVFQTILPALLVCGSDMTVAFKGGTHNHGGPPWDFLDEVFLPIVRRMGAQVSVRLERHGFAPAGGGRWTAAISRSELRPVSIHERGRLRSAVAQALVSNLPLSIAEREIAALRPRLDWRAEARCVESDGPGNIVMLCARYENVAELATGFGRRGVPAESVAREALECWLSYEASAAPVGEHLADQLLLPMALARGGSFVTMKPTLHTTTNIETIRKFLDVRFRVEQTGGAQWLIAAEPA